VKDNTPLDKVQRYICNRAAGVCKKKPPPVTKRSERPRERFSPSLASAAASGARTHAPPSSLRNAERSQFRS